MVNKRGREGARAGAWRATKMFSSFTCCSRRSFVCVDGELGNDGHRVMLLLTLRRLRRYLFVYSSSKFSKSCFNAFRCALLVVAVLYANWLYFQLFRKFLLPVFLIFLFFSGAEVFLHSSQRCANRTVEFPFSAR